MSKTRTAAAVLAAASITLVSTAATPAQAAEYKLPQCVESLFYTYIQHQPWDPTDCVPRQI